VVVIHFASAQCALADSTVIPPNQIIERNFLVYEVGSNTPFSGSVVSTRYDGSTDYEEQYVDGKLHGRRTAWDRLGNKISETTFANGAKTGPETFWYDNGQVMAVTYFVKGGRHGQFLRWCRNGQKRYERSYANNMMDGLQVDWYANGQKRSEGIYVDDRRGDRFTRWYENGRLWSDYKVDAVRQVSTTTFWFANGQKQCETVFSKSEGKPLTRTAWDESGNRLEIDGQDYLAYCKSSFGPAALRPGERVVSVRYRSDTTKRYSTVGGDTTATEAELSDSDRERIELKAKDLDECGLPRVLNP